MSVPTRVILVRHGQSTYNAQGRYQGCSDQAVLTDAGRLAAYQTGIYLSQFGIETIYTSPLQRTQATTQEIQSAMAATGAPVPVAHTHALLREIDLPNWEGLTFQQVRQDQAALYQRWRDQPQNFEIAQPDRNTGMGGTAVATQTAIQTATKPFYPVRALFEQARQFWQTVLSQQTGKTILIVSHGGTIKALLATATQMGLPEGDLAEEDLAEGDFAQEAHFHLLQQSNCGVSVLEFSAPGQAARLLAMNLTAHLGEVLPKIKDGKQGLRLLLVPAPTPAQSPEKVSGKMPEEILEKTLEQLGQRLHQIPIHFCLSSYSEAQPEITQMAAGLLAEQRSQPVHLQVRQDNFLTTWHQTIQTRAYQPAEVSSGLVIANLQAMTSILATVLQIPTTALQLQTGGINLLYYPVTAKHPILQSLNFSAPCLFSS
jgi:phosphoserine phosphatase